MIYYFQKPYKKAKINDKCGVNPLTSSEQMEIKGTFYTFLKEFGDELLEKNIIALEKKIKK